MPRTKGETKQSQFRLRPETLADLDLIATHLTETTGAPHSMTDAVRYAARQVAGRLKKTSKKISESG